MKPLSKTKKILATVIAINLAGMGLYAFFYFAFKRVNLSTIELLSESEKDLKKDEFLRAARLALANNSSDIKKVDSYFVKADAVAEFIESIEELGRISGANLTVGSVSVEPDTRSKDDFKEVLRLKVEAVGSWSQLVNLFSMIENIPYKLVIDNVSANRLGSLQDLFFGEEDNSSDGSWKGYMEFSVLKLK